MTQEPQTRSAKGKGRGIAIAVSLAAHAVALGLLAWNTPALRLPTTTFAPDVTIELVRSIPLQRRAPEPVAAPRPAAAAPAAAPTQTARRAPAPPPPLPPLPTPSRPSPRPTQPAPPSPSPAPSPAAPGPAIRPGPANAAAPTSDGPGGDVRGAVRAAIGCSHEEFLKLNAAERAACEWKMAERPAVGAYVDPISPLKRRDFDRQAAADARRRDHEGSMPNPIGRCEGVGSNLGFGCLPPEAMHHSGSGGSTPIGSPEPRP